MPTPTIVPAILAKSRVEFEKKLKQIEGAAPIVQVDVMDGRFVPNRTWHDASAVAKLKTKTTFELHLMVNDPMPIVNDWMQVKGLRRVIFHVESPIRIGTLIKTAKKEGLEVGLAIAPDTPLRRVLAHLKDIDMILVMGGKPGFSGKPLDSNTIDTVRAIRKKSRTIPIGFDIGVSHKTIPTLVQAGVTRLCAASAVFKTASPKRALRALNALAAQAARVRP